MSPVNGWEQQLAQNAQHYQQLQDRVAQLALTETSRDGAVQVTVSASGVLTDLVLRERGQPRPLAHLAGEIMDCVRRAQARIPALLHSSINATVGAHDTAAQLIVADARTRFPAPPPPRPRPAVADDRRNAAQRAEPPPPPTPNPRRLPVQPTGSRSGPAPADTDWDERPLMEDA